MKTINTSEIKNRNIVATYNADAFAVEYDEQLDEVMAALGEQAERYDANDEEFAELAEKLDGDTTTYEYILTNGYVTVGVLK